MRLSFPTVASLALLLSLILVPFCRCAEPTPSRLVVYKRVGDTELKLHLFEPPGLESREQRPCIVFFFGGGWRSGSPSQFYPQCAHLAARGMVAISAEYRVESRHGTSPFECVMDGKSAIRWVRAHAAELGVDPQRIAAGGGSAGGHVAAATATVPALDEPGEDRSISARPDALVLFNPVYDNGPNGWGHDRVGDRYREISPRHNIRAGMPPTLVLLGTKDRLIPVATAKAFQKAMHEVGSQSELILYEGKEHGFFNPGRGDGTSYRETLAEADTFLSSLGYLTPPEAGKTSEEGHVTARSGELRVVLADNAAFAPTHRAGYNGVAELFHGDLRQNLFVPSYAGLNLEHIFSGDERSYGWDIFEPRRAPMRLERLARRAYALRQERTEHWPLSTSVFFSLSEPDAIDVAVRCVPRRDLWSKHGYIGLFFASYIAAPENRAIHFLGRSRGESGERAPHWIRHLPPSHGVAANHRPSGSTWDPPLDPGFNVHLVAGISDYEYAYPFYYGVTNGKVLMFFFERPRGDDEIRFAQSPTGGGKQNPAWDFIFLKRGYRIGDPFGFRLRLVVRDFRGDDDVIGTYESWSGERVPRPR